MSKDEYTDDDVIKSPWIKWGKVGDNIYGTLVSVTPRDQVSMKTNLVEKVLVYEVKAGGGEYHEIDAKKNPIEPAIQIVEGSIYNVGDHFTIHASMKNIKIGQKLKIAFTEEKPSKTKGNAPMKVRAVYSKGLMDEEWLKEQQGDTDNYAQE